MVEVASTRDTPPQKSALLGALDDESRRSGEISEVDRSEAARLTENHIGASCLVSAGVIAPGANDNVCQAIMVDVAGAGDAIAGTIARVVSPDEESGRADIGEINGREAIGLAED